MLKRAGLEYGLKSERGKFGSLASIRGIFIIFLPSIPPTRSLQPSQVTNADKKCVAA